MSEQTPKSDIFYQIKNGTRATAAMLAGMKLDLFTPLKDGPLPAVQLATKLGVDAGKLGPLLYALVVAGLLTEQDGTFSNTPETDAFLVKGKVGYLGDAHKIWYSNLLASLQTADTIRAGVPQAKYDWTNMAAGELKALHEGMAASDVAFANQLSAKYDFSQCRRLLDAGGGSGTFAITMTQIHPHLNATVVDLPEVTPITEQFVMDADASSRVKVVPADLTRDPLPGMYDVAILSSVIQTLSAEAAQQVINNVGKVINPGGWLYIFGGGMLDNSRLSPKTAVEWNLVFINTYDGGQSYTEEEHQDWLTEAGFEDFKFKPKEFTITARKRAD
ncbi:MAG: methyltransferase domain-containing protein [Chloroflexi bacterium]|nr:methyltransferase domain-containing protein [Chloroflexota bacterium]